jgi:hypothetical protein
MKEFRHRTCIICDEMHGRRYMCGPCWCRVWNKFDVGILESHPKASESSRDQSIRDMMADRGSSPEKFYENLIVSALARL